MSINEKVRSLTSDELTQYALTSIVIEEFFRVHPDTKMDKANFEMFLDIKKVVSKN